MHTRAHAPGGLVALFVGVGMRFSRIHAAESAIAELKKQAEMLDNSRVLGTADPLRKCLGLLELLR